MDTPDKWEMAGRGLMNLQAMLLADAAVVRVLRMWGKEVRHLGFERGVRLLFEKEEKDRFQTSRDLKSLVTGRTGLDQFGIGPAVWAVMRLQCAGDFLGQMFPPLAKSGPCAEIKGDWTVEDAYLWLLTELWERRFDSWLKLTALEWTGPFPFYGIGPAPDWL